MTTCVKLVFAVSLRSSFFRHNLYCLWDAREIATTAVLARRKCINYRLAHHTMIGARCAVPLHIVP